MLNNKTSFIIILLIAIIATIIALFLINQKYSFTVAEIPKFFHRPPIKSIAPTASSALDTIYKIPDTKYLPVPFTPQAPTANWDILHNEACEEATSIMAYAYFGDCPVCHSELDSESISGSRLAGRDDITNLPSDFVEGQIDLLTKWQDKNFGYHLDTTSAETAQMIEQVYGLQIKLMENFTSDDIKRELAQNHLVIISENGRLLNNPNYKRPGPIHHMLLIKGYDAEGNFITNDSGTKRGLNYKYTFNVIYNAAADWDHAINSVDANKKIMIAVWK